MSLFQICSKVSMALSAARPTLFLQLALSLLIVVGRAQCAYNPIYRTFTSESGHYEEANCSKPCKVGARNVEMFLEGGLSPSLWNNVHHLLGSNESFAFALSPRCAQDITSVYKGLAEGRLWSFNFIDSGSGLPAGLLDGTTSDLGEYDQCLGIRSPRTEEGGSFEGMYCQVTVFPWATQPSSGSAVEPGLRLDVIGFEHMGISQALCLPSTCSIHDLVTIVRQGKPLHILSETMHCDTLATNSLQNKLARLTNHQRVAITLLATTVACVLLGTAADVLVLRGDLAAFLAHFSMVSNARRLFATKATGVVQRIDYVDLFKLYLIALSLVAHIVFCIESPIFPTLMRRVQDVKRVLESPYAAVVVADGGFVTLSFMGGFTSYQLIQSRMSVVGSSYAGLLLNKWIRYLPAIIGIVSLEFCWPLVSSGPFYTPAANYILDKCTKYWFMNILSLTNWITVEKLCAGHTYYSAVDTQLFLLALLAVYVLKKNSKLGLVLISVLIASGFALIYYFAWKHETQPFLATPVLNQADVVLYLNYIHMATHGYLSAYFIGLVIGWTYSNNIRASVSSRTTYATIAGVTQFAALLSPMLHNAYALIPRNWMPLYIVTNKVLYTTSVVAAFKFLETYSAIENDSDGRRKESAEKLDGKRLEKATQGKASDEFVKGQKSERQEDERPRSRQRGQSRFSVLKGAARLSFSMYMANYYFVRSDMFSDRGLQDNSLESWGKRIIYSFEYILLFAFVFHLLFVGPFESMREFGLLGRATDQKEKEA